MWNALKKARLAHLDQLAKHGEVQSALLVGEGNGSFLLAFVEYYPEAEVLVIDSCPAMIEKAKERLKLSDYGGGKVRFELTDMREVNMLEDEYDVVVTHFFFDNFDQTTTDELAVKIAKATKAKAQWLWADFQIPQSAWQALRARFWLKILYLFFGRVASVSVRQLPDAEKAIEAFGFKLIETNELCGQLLRTSHYSMRSGKCSDKLPACRAIQ